MKTLYKILFIFVLLLSTYACIGMYTIYIQERAVRESFEGSRVVLNPYDNAPLTAIVDIDIPQNGFFNIKVEKKGKKGIPLDYKISHSGGRRDVRIMGLYPGYLNKVELTFLNTKGIPVHTKSYEIQTPKYPGEKPEIDILKNELGSTYEGLYGFVNSLTLFDQNGDIRWYLHNDDFHSLFLKLKNGNFLVASKTNMVMYQLQDFYEISVMGNIVQKYTVPKMYHHEILELENGNFLTTGNSESFSALTDSMYREDTIVEIDRESGKIIEEFNINNVLYGIRPSYQDLEEVEIFFGNIDMSTNTGDWAHINSLYIDSQQNIIFSMRTIDMIASMNWKTKKLNWVLSHKSHEFDSTKDFSLSFEEGSISEGDFYYPLAQHSAFLKEGYLYTFDNGNGRSTFSTHQETGLNYSRVLKYNIDESNRRILSVSSYVHPEMIYTPFTGNVSLLENSNMLIGYTVNKKGGIRLVIMNHDGEILFEAMEKSIRNDYRVIHTDIINEKSL